MTVAEERAYALKMRHPELGIESPGYGLIAQAVFFVLTAVGIGAFYAMTDAKLVTAVLCIAVAEYLILGRNWFYTGVEAALWIGGLLSALSMLPNTGAPEANLLIALCFAIAAARVRQPLFGGAAAFFVAQYLERRFDLGTLAALAIAGAALVALYRVWKRPSNEWLFIVLLVGMPLAGWSFADRQWLWITFALYSLFSAVCFASALVKRHHAMFAGAASAAIVAGVKAHDIFHPPEELSLAVAGSLLLLASLAVSRALRGRTRGFVLVPSKPAEIEEGLQILGTIASAPSAGNPPEQRPQDGGGFGGAGTTEGW